MATLKISEYTSLAPGIGGGGMPAPLEPAAVVQNITFAASTASAAFAAGTKYVRLVADAKAHFEFGAAPTAAATDPYLPADRPEFFGVTPGAKVAVYDGVS